MGFLNRRSQETGGEIKSIQNNIEFSHLKTF